jgi:hypothetical protein
MEAKVISNSVMKLPVSFDEVSYFKNEYRGDLIITSGILHYFPHTRVSASHFTPEIGGKDAVEAIGWIGGNFVPTVGSAPYLHTAAEVSVKLGKFLRRFFLPSMNSPKIRKANLWSGREPDVALQNILDSYIEKARKTKLEFADDSVPKPMRFLASDMENVRIKFKLKFDAGYDNHDFRVSPLLLGKFKKALKEGGFLR